MLPLLFSVMGTVYDLSTMASTYTDQGTPTQTYFVRFWFRVTSDGTVDVTRNVNGNSNDVATYVRPAASQNLWVRCTVTGDAFNLGDTTGSWLTLTGAQQRSFGLQKVSGGGVDLFSSTVTFEIAVDSGGTNIVATKSGITVTVGETS